MLSFKQFISESTKMRKGLPHLKDIKPQELHSLISGGKIKGRVTEKTDGLAFSVGHDEHGPYTRSARSDKVRIPGGYTTWNRENKPDNISPYASHYDEIHHHLTSNPKLMDYLKTLHKKSGGKDISMQGEMFWKPLGEENEKGVKFVGTHYDPKKMGSHGTFVLHSELANNAHHDPEHVKTLGNEHINFDHDKVSNGNVNVDVSDELKDYEGLDHDKMNSRKKDDIEEKELNKRKFESIKSRIEGKLRDHIDNKIKPKFGNETEGHVFHPEESASNRGAPKFKLTSTNFAAFKAKEKK